MTMNQEKIRKTYSDIKEQNELLLAGLKKKQLLISLLRLLVFVGGGILSVIASGYSAAGTIFVILVTLFSFLLLVKKFGDYSDKITITVNLIRINNNEINALEGDYSAFDGGKNRIDPKHDFSDDIDLFGDDSLFRYLNRTVTGPGRSLLAGWLSDPYSLRELVPERQKAVGELAGKLAWRQQFMANGLDKPLNEEEIEDLSRWLNETDNFYSSVYMKLSCIILPVAVVTTLLLVIAGALPFIFFVFLFLLNLMVIGIFIKKSNKVHAMVSQKHIFLSSIGELIKSFEKEEFTSSLLADVKNKISGEEGSVAEKIRKLDTIIWRFDSRLNLFAGLILNGLLLWDFQCIRQLEKWRGSAASGLPRWLNLIGEVDGLMSFANYAYNNPDHCFPVVIDEGPVLEAFRMGHPLLKKETRVDNDFTIHRPGQVIIITGANMAGKSTFLRTVAVNMVLALAGAPVCAEKMRLSPVRLFTSMRTTDSLSRNESYFYAELKRLKTLKEKLEMRENDFFILDEILKGTNSTDKSTGSRMFLRRLVELGGTGLIATHDISLGDMEDEFPENIENKCFEIDIDGENINFDYKIHDGITRKMNATLLMKQMGIG